MRFSQNYKKIHYRIALVGCDFGRSNLIHYNDIYPNPPEKKRIISKFYTQILTKKPKIQKTSKTMRFLTKLQNTSIYNFGSKNIFLFSDFVFHPFL